MTVEQRLALNEIVWADPERMGGVPCFRGTRVPVQILIEYLEESTLDEFLEGYPSVSREQAIAFIELAKDLLLEGLLTPAGQ